MSTRKYTFITFLLLAITIATMLFYRTLRQKNIIAQPVKQASTSSRFFINKISTTTTAKSEVQTKPGTNIIKNDNPKYISPTAITITAGDKVVTQIFEQGQSLYDILVQASKSSALGFYGKEYPGLGFFVTDIGNLSAVNGKYLQYYVNGKYASVGVSDYIPKDGDVILWKLE